MPQRMDNVEDPRSLAATGGHIILVGDLAATTALGNSESANELVNILGYVTIAVELNVSGVTGNPVVSITPMGQNATTELTALAPSDVTLTDGDNVISYTPKGHHHIKVTVTCDADDEVTLDEVRVTGRAIAGV
jgi:hypothetical protein